MIIGIIQRTKQAYNNCKAAEIKEEVYIAWNSAQTDGIHNGWDLSKKVDQLENELKGKDKNVHAMRRENEQILDVSYRNQVTEIPLTNEYEQEEELDQNFNGKIYKGEHSFNGEDFLNTEICLYSEENINKNFEISFDIINVGGANVFRSTLLSSMNESGSPWPGHNVKITEEGTLKIESNSNTSSTGDISIPASTKNVKIVRINHILYCSFDGRKCVKLNDFTGFTDYFDVPVTFGGALDGNNNPMRYFYGTIANMYIKFLDDDITIDEYNPKKKPMLTLYSHKDAKVFDGQTNIVTQFKLFDLDHIDKDFEVSFNIDEIDIDHDEQATFINGKYEDGNKYPGFAFRITTDKNIEFTSKGGKDVNKIKMPQDDVKSVKLRRSDRKIYVSINDEEEIEVYDYTTFKLFHNIPLTIGSSLSGDGITGFRYFKGILSDITIKVEPD